MLLHDKIAELNIPDNDIVQIRTDGLFYKNAALPKNLDPSDINGWKEIDMVNFREFKSDVENPGLHREIIAMTDLQLYRRSTSTRILHMRYAGNGKTYKIINEIIPRLIKKKISYIVLTPTHSTTSAYRNEIIEQYPDHKINCEILQNYSNTNTIPKEDYIIIDEIGFCGASCHDFILKLDYLNKSFECFGDFNQLLPVGESRPYNQPHYLKYLFREIYTGYGNFRNNFSKTYYDSLITCKPKYIVKEVAKFSNNDFMNTDKIICFRNKTRHDMNNYVLKRLGLDRYGIGSEIMAISNKLGEYDIWNHQEFIIKYYEETFYGDIEVILEDIITKKIYNIPSKFLNKHFDHNYCITIYAAQGKTFNTLTWAHEDDAWLDSNDIGDTPNRIGYTFISRIKQDLTTPIPFIKLYQKLGDLENFENNYNI
jgi:hypothetical protein